MPYSCKASLRSLVVAIAAAALASLGYGQATTLVGSESISGTATVLSGGNLTLASGSTMTYAVAGTTNSLLYLSNSGGNVGALGLGAGLSVSGGNLVAASSTTHNPTATIGLSAVNGVASTVMASDSAPALSQAIVPIWTGLHTFSPTAAKTSGTDYGIEFTPTLNQRNATNFSLIYGNETITQAGSGNQYLEELAVSTVDKWVVDSTGTVKTGAWNGSVVGPTYGGTGTGSFAQGTTLTANAANTWTALAPGTVNYVYTSGGAAANTSWQSLSTIMDTLGSAAQGDILYRNGSSWVFLAPGTSGQLLETLGAGANPAWANASTPPGSTTAHDVVSYSNTTGALEDTTYMNFASNIAALTTNTASLNGSLYITNNNNGNTVVVMDGLAPSIATGSDHEVKILFGVAQSSKNLGYIGMNYAGSGNANNYIAIGTYGTDDLWTLSPVGAVSQKGTTTTYNNVATAGIGLTPVVSTPRLTAQTSAQSLTAYTVPGADSSYEVSANVLVTAATTANFTVTCTYTDEGNTSRTLTLGFTQLSGATFLTAITNVTGTGPYESPSYHIRCKASTTITFATTGTFTSVTYNVEGTVIQLQ